MDMIKTVLNFASEQTNLGLGLISLLTAGGEQIFSSVLFRCPCNQLNWVYGLVFLLVPALALLLLGYILSKRTWKLLMGLRQCQAQMCHWRRTFACSKVLFQISTIALVAPSSWIAVALLSGDYFECAMTGTNVSIYSKHLCEGMDPGVQEQCQRELHKFPCGRGSSIPQADREDVLLTLRAQSQIIGWLLIASIMLSNLLLTCLARLTSPVSYLQLKFWRAYAQEENSLMDSYMVKHASELAERNLKSFFNRTRPTDIVTPSNKDWEKISSLYKFSSQDHYYSTLHQCVEKGQDAEGGMMRLASIRSRDSAVDNPAVLNFVDNGGMAL